MKMFIEINAKQRNGLCFIATQNTSAAVLLTERQLHIYPGLIMHLSEHQGYVFFPTGHNMFTITAHTGTD
jgi:hypothetical protein